MNRKLKIGEKEYSFKLTNKTVLELDELYENWGSIFNGIMNGSHSLNCALKLISLSCVNTTKEFNKNTREYDQRRTVFTPEGLMLNLTPQQLTYEVVDLSIQLILDYMGVKESIEGEENKESDIKKK